MSVSRRDFAATLAAATIPASLPLNPVMAGDQKEPPKKEASKSEPSAVDPLTLEIALWLELIRCRYPDARLTPDVLKLIAGDATGDISHSRRISAFPLKNADAPVFVL